MRCINACVSTFVMALVLIACGGATPNPTATRTAISNQTGQTIPAATEPATVLPEIVRTATPARTTAQSIQIDPIIAPDLATLVAGSAVIFIGTVMGSGDIVNLARDVTNISQPDPQIFGLGQIYRVQVERYLKGGGPQSQNVIQPEGFLYSEAQPVAASLTSAEIEAAKAAYAYVPMRLGTRYLLFVEPVKGFDPGLNYVTGAVGYPWRFTLPVNGSAQPESPVAEANALFPARSSATLLQEVNQLLAASR